MVMLKWLHTILNSSRQEVSQAAAGQATNEIKKSTKTRSIDLVNAALVDHAEDLMDLISSGTALTERKRLKRCVKQKVQKAIADEFDDPDIIEEVTERITDAAEIDPFYKKLFCND